MLGPEYFISADVAAGRKIVACLPYPDLSGPMGPSLHRLGGFRARFAWSSDPETRTENRVGDTHILGWGTGQGWGTGADDDITHFLESEVRACHGRGLGLSCAELGLAGQRHV